MLRVTIELVPFGDEARKKSIATMVIANDGTGSSQTGAYEAWTAADTWSGTEARYGKIDGYDRSKSVWELLSLMLNNILSGASKPSNKKSSLAQRLKGKL